MARRNTKTPPLPDDFEETILDIDVSEEMRGSYLEYAYSVIYARAIPDARDGLKPVQRRILFQMNEMGLRPDRAHVKCGRVVGDVMGKLHPHGDGAIYDTIVRMQQPWVMRLPLVDGHGNFGSLDAPPAAYRYCITGDTRVRTPSGGTPRIEDLVGLPANSEADADFAVLDKDGKPVRVSRVFNSGAHPTKRITTHDGYELRGSHNHPVLCLVPVLGVPMFQWLRLDEVSAGTVVCLARNASVTELPGATDVDLGILAGAWVTEGSAVEKEIPEYIWNGSPGLKRAFLMAAFEGDGSFVRDKRDSLRVQFRSHSRKLARGIQDLLLEFGVYSHLSHFDTGEYRLVISARHNVRAFYTRVGFLTVKRDELGDALDSLPDGSRALSGDYVPFVTQYVRDALPSKQGWGREWFTRNNFDRVERWQSRRALLISKFKDDEVLRTVLPIMDSGYRFDTVATVVEDDPAEVYSLRVDSDDHSFLAGGFVNHNTECRMAQPAMLMTGSLDEDVVDMIPNYDGQFEQPDVLPAAFPNLLVNGANGIAVGMATNMAPHNLGEVIEATRHLLANPDASLDDLMRFVPGPDLPSGGRVNGLDGVREAYETGRGSFKTRATARVENITARRKGIVITELPYMVGPERIRERIVDLVKAKKLSGIADVVDYTDRNTALRLVIELKSGFVPEAVLEELYRLTPLEDSFSINNVALVDGQPRTLGLKELLEVFIKHRLEVVRRRTEFRRKKAADRLHLVDGLLIALLDIDEVIAVIRSSDDAASARTRLMEIFDLSEVQATYILDTPLRRLTKYDRLELQKEADELRRTIDELTALLEDEALMRRAVSDELAEVSAQHSTPRRTVLLEGSVAPARATAVSAGTLEVSDDPCQVLLSSTGLLARTSDDSAVVSGAKRAKHDLVLSSAASTARGHVGVVTSAGRLVKLSALELPSLPPSASVTLTGGAPLSEFLELDRDERVVCLTTLADDSRGLAIGTSSGVVKRVVPDHPSNKDSWDVVRLDDGDSIVGAVELRTGEEELVFISSDAQLLHFPASGVRPQGRSGGGIAGIRLGSGASARFFGAVDGSVPASVVTVAGTSAALPGTQAGALKVTPFDEYPAKGRGTGGVRCHRFLKGEDTLIVAWAGAAPALAAAASGVPITLPEADGRRDGSGSPAPQPIAAVASALTSPE